MSVCWDSSFPVGTFCRKIGLCMVFHPVQQSFRGAAENQGHLALVESQGGAGLELFRKVGCRPAAGKPGRVGSENYSLGPYGFPEFVEKIPHG